jgi:hypothetical protein
MLFIPSHIDQPAVVFEHFSTFQFFINNYTSFIFIPEGEYNILCVTHCVFMSPLMVQCGDLMWSLVCLILFDQGTVCKSRQVGFVDSFEPSSDDIMLFFSFLGNEARLTF